MARQVREVVIATEGRDKGKTFVITELPADQGERWANRLMFALANAGTKLPAGSIDNGMAGVAHGLRDALSRQGVGVLGGLHYSDVSGLLDDMMGSVQYQPQPGILQAIYPGANSQIEEINTRWQIRMSWIELHMGFLLAGVSSTSGSSSATPPA